jgi:tRNA-splicing ligase RtcB
MGHADLVKVSEELYEIPPRHGMRVPGRIYASARMLPDITKDCAHQQVANVAHLPGIVGYSLAMPDIHWGYGFPIGGVAAFDWEEGIISPGGVGYDINCGVRLMHSDILADDVLPELENLVQNLFERIPSGVGSRGPIRVGRQELDQVLTQGAGWAVKRGYGSSRDLPCIEENGAMPGANPDLCGNRARQRGSDQLGTLGSGNHFVEVGYVEEVFDTAAAEAMGLALGRITLMIHTGSRGFGHQICDDFLRVMLKASRRYGIELPDRQLCCAPLTSDEGQNYLAAMAAAVNFAFANRQIISHLATESFAQVLGKQAAASLGTVYEVAHNIAKIETHEVDGRQKKLCVHRKGATRAFAAGHSELPERYADIGQPVLIPGDMGRCSYVLRGQEAAMQQTFGSACHGAGRRMSRKQALRQGRGRRLFQEMREQGVIVRARGHRTVAEEMPEAYKDVSQVVETVHAAGLATKVVRMKPLGVIKG